MLALEGHPDPVGSHDAGAGSGDLTIRDSTSSGKITGQAPGKGQPPDGGGRGS
ncbi:MAG: hypothetical protein ACLU38_05600 [Dysosmobacter sp.]